MLTKRRTPFSSSRRSRKPGCFFSKFSMSSATVRPSALTSSCPPVSVRRGVGIRTMVLLEFSLQGLRGAGRAHIAILDQLGNARRVTAQRTARAPGNADEPQLVGAAVEGGDLATELAAPARRVERHLG